LNTNVVDSDKNLRKLIISLVVVFSIFIVLLIASMVIFFNYQSTVKESKRTEQKQISVENIKIIQEWVAAKNQAIAAFSENDRIKSMKNDEIQQALDEFVNQNPEYEMIFVLGPDGKSLASSDGRESDLSSRASFKQSLSGIPVVNGPLLSKNTRKIVIGFSFPIISNTSVVGVVYALIPIEKLTTNIANSAPGKSGEIYIIDSDGYLVTPSRFDDDLKKMGIIKESSAMELRIDSFAKTQLQDGIDGTSEYRNYLGNSVLGTYARLSEPDWGLIVEQGTDEAYIQIRSGGIVLLISVIVLILVTLLLIIISVVMFISSGKNKNNEKILRA